MLKIKTHKNLVSLAKITYRRHAIIYNTLDRVGYIRLKEWYRCGLCVSFYVMIILIFFIGYLDFYEGLDLMSPSVTLSGSLLRCDPPSSFSSMTSYSRSSSAILPSYLLTIIYMKLRLLVT